MRDKLAAQLRIGRLIRLMIIVFVCGTHSAAEEIQPAMDRPQPKSPAASAACVKLPLGFRLDLVASEPMLREPAAMCFDAQGRLFVGEIHGYNLDGYLDIVELNKTGKLDREVRRVRYATPESQATAHKETYGTVRMLRDADGDGKMDESHVWADRLPPCYGLIAVRDGVIVICAPDIVFLADRDGDGQAEVRETLFTGFARTLIERGINTPRWGQDNWIYVAAGGGGGEITGPKLKEPVKIGNTDFRIKPDGSAIEPVTGREGMFGLALTDFGDRFHTIVTYTAPLPYHYLARNPYVQSPPSDVGIAPGRTIYPISQPDPWRNVRGQDPAWVKFYGAAETMPNGQFTASSGQMIYRAAAWPEAYRGNYFVCDPANNLVHRCLLERNGSAYTARRAPEEEQSEFLASTDQWFRPIGLSIGPDGAVYIIDMYREIIEDFSAIPRFLQQQYSEALIAGSNHGRIWRLSWQGDSLAAPKKPEVQLDQAAPAQWIRILDDPNHWQRDTAQRLLLERGDKSVQADLAKFVRQGKSAPGRMQSLYVLDGLSLLTPGDLEVALADDHYGVRLHALQLADRWIGQQPKLLDKLVSMTDDPEERVRIQLALSLGESQEDRATEALVRLAVAHGNEPWMSAAIVSSLASKADQFVAKLLAADPTGARTQAVLGPVAETIGAQGAEQAIGNFLKQTASLSGSDSSSRQLALLERLVRGLERVKIGKVSSATIVQELEKLLSSSSADVSQIAVRIAGLLQLSQSPAMQAAWDAAVKSAADPDRPLANRLAAVSLLQVAAWEQQKLLQQLLDSRQPTELQLAAVKALGRADHADVSAALLANWSGLVPKVQDAIVDAIISRRDRLPQLLKAIEQGVVPPATLSALRQEQLIEHRDPAIRETARRVLAGRMNDGRAAVLKSYAAALTLPRDPKRGEAVYEKTCSKCHRLGTKGHEVGPDLQAARTRPDETLLVDLLDPSATLAHGFTVYTIATTDGRVHTGLLADETATSITLRNAAEPNAKSGSPAVVLDIVLRKDIEEIKAMSKSLMPDSLEKEVTPQNVADLIGFLRHSLGPVVSPSLVLFEDELAFLESLNEGDAKVQLSDDHFSGKAALRLTAGQKFSPKISGWNYRIVEHPEAPTKGKPSEPASPAVRSYRYLRFAWKSAGAKGVLFELAADGAWPPANQPIRRYYSGQNTSGWAATEVSPEVPTEWTVVTVDLWKDFGEFTLTGIAPTAMGGPALFDRIELLPAVEDRPVAPLKKE